MLTLTLSLLCSLTALPAHAAAAKSHAAALAKVRKAIEAANARWAEAQMKGDAASIGALFADDGVELSARSGRAWKGRDSLLALWVRIFADGHPSDAAVTTSSVCLMGKTAAELGTYAYTFPPADSSSAPRTVKGRYCVVWRQQPDDNWKIFMDMGVPFDD